MAIKVRKIERLINDLCSAGDTYRYPEITKDEYKDLLRTFFTAIGKINEEYKDTIVITKLYQNMVIVFDHSEMNVVMVSDTKASVYKKQIPSSELFNKLLESLPEGFGVSTFMIEDVFDLLRKCIALNIICNPMTAIVIHADKSYVVRPFMYGGAIGVWGN